MTEHEIVSAYVNVKYDSFAKEDVIAKSLSRLPYVKSVDSISGESDLVLFLNVKGGINALNSCIDEIRSVKGVENTISKIVLKSYK